MMIDRPLLIPPRNMAHAIWSNGTYPPVFSYHILVVFFGIWWEFWIGWVPFLQMGDRRPTVSVGGQRGALAIVYIIASAI